jgi:hypothetical protein
MNWLVANVHHITPILALLVAAMAIFVGFRSRQAKRAGLTYSSRPVMFGIVVLVIVSCFIMGIAFSHMT